MFELLKELFKHVSGYKLTQFAIYQMLKVKKGKICQFFGDYVMIEGIGWLSLSLVTFLQMARVDQMRLSD